MGVSFNLIDQPWIPCLFLDGTYKEVSLRDVLRDALLVREVYDDSPLVTVSLHRLLLAILHRVFGPETTSEWLRLWNARAFDLEPSEYLAQWHARFDLFDEEYPFYQVGGLATKEPQPVGALFQELACGNNVTLFDHNLDSMPVSLTPAAAARGLLAMQQFAIGFGKSPTITVRDQALTGKREPKGYRTDGPLLRGMGLLLSGENLFETLLCNLSQYEQTSGEAPQWERDDPLEVVQRDRDLGRVDLYTWQTRLLRLEPEPGPDGAVAVRYAHVAQGRELAKPKDGPHMAFDPLKAYQKHETRGWEPLGFREDRSLWRDSGALLMLADPAKPPESVHWLARLARAGALPRRLVCSIAALGVAAEAGKAGNIILWRHERMQVPLAYLADDGLTERLVHSVREAESAEGKLRHVCWQLCGAFLAPDAERKADAGDIDRLLTDLAPTRYYWTRLEEPFRRVLRALPEDPETAHGAWRRAIADQYRAAFSATVKALGTTDRAIRAVAQTEGLAEHLIREMIPEEATHGE